MKKNPFLFLFKTRLFQLSSAFLSTLVITSCAANHATSSMHDSPALRTSTDQASQTELQQVIAKSLFGATATKVKLAKNALTQTNSVIIEREIILGRDLTTPTVFKLFKNNQHCILVNMRSKQRYTLVNMECR